MYCNSNVSQARDLVRSWRVFQCGIVEYLSSLVLIDRHTQYKDAITRLRAKGITLLSDPCFSDKSAELCYRVLQAEFEKRLAVRTGDLRREGEEPQSAETASNNRKGKDNRYLSFLSFAWENLLARSQVDVALAFVTADQNVERDFGDGLNDQGVTMYTVDIPWLKSGDDDSTTRNVPGRPKGENKTAKAQ
ncbi:hypothetical protein TWF281_001547 [Arthrobotrys megalospora]